MKFIVIYNPERGENVENLAKLYMTILGSILLGIGAMGIVWFLRNHDRPRYNQARAYLQYKWIVILVILGFICGGLPLVAVGGKVIFIVIFIVLGMIAGWIVSR